MKRKHKDFDKYDYYIRSVQSPDGDAEFLLETYREIRHKKPKILREDFCGTFALCCEWVKLNRNFKAVGVDLDTEPLTYGAENYFIKLNKSQQGRLKILCENVLNPRLPKADIVCAMNFSYFIFKTRRELKKYFVSVLKGLRRNGIFLLDLFGGSACYLPNLEETKHRSFTYLWDQENFDPINSRAKFHIGYRLKNPRKLYKQVFTYDWRMWTIPELREILEEAGFKKSIVYWEGLTRAGNGDGNYKPVETAKADAAWVAYIVGVK